MLSFPNESRSNTYGQVTAKSMPVSALARAKCFLQGRWRNRLLLVPRFSFPPLVCSENEIDLGLPTFDIPVSRDQPLASLGDQHSLAAPFHLAQSRLGSPELQQPQVAATVLKKLGALSPEMWGEPGLRRLPCCVMFASSFPSGREKIKLGWASSFLASAACQIGLLLFCLPYWLILRF